jgi:tetratricopeptide (TPR) repeat protein
MSESASDIHYTHAVALFEQGCTHLATSLEQEADYPLLRITLLDSCCALARCHSRVGRADLAEATYQHHLRGQIESFVVKRTDPKHGLSVLNTMGLLSHALRQAGLHAAALHVAREGATLTTDYSAYPLHHPELDFRMGCIAWELARALRELGDAAAALQQAEHSRKLFTDYWQERPQALTRGVQLGQAWTEIGKAQWELGRTEEAWAAFQEGTAIQRRIFEQAPTVLHHRVFLSLYYDRLVEYGIRRHDWLGAASALREREQLWPNNAEKLLKVSQDFAALAQAMTRAGKTLSADEQAQRQSYLAESERCRHAGETAASRAGK